MEFKLLAFKINKISAYTKNLKKALTYKFTEEFQFIYDKNSSSETEITRPIEINCLNTYPTDLYDIENAGKKTNINITAIVGQNGSGKSSLFELFYLLLYAISERKNLLGDRNRNKRLYDNKKYGDYYSDLNRKIDEILEISQFELYYKFGDSFYLIANSGKQINFYALEDKKWVVKEFERSNFFYTISVNYSLYGLNSNGNYFWLDGLFHKNDGYKTPVVITPYRENGNININTELHLAQTRILANLISESFEAQNIIDDKIFGSIAFKIIPDDIGKIDIFSLKFLYRHTKEQNKVDLIGLFEKIITGYDESLKPELDEVLNLLKEDFAKKEIDNDRLLKEFSFDNQKNVDGKLVRVLLAKYIIAKIVKICMRYTDFRQFTSLWAYKENNIADIFLLNNVKDLPQKLKRDQTHVTLKLKQAINAFLFKYLKENKWIKMRNPENLERVIYTTSLDYEDFKIMIKNAFFKSKQKGKIVTHFIPTGFFLPSIFVKENNETYPFEQMSSGEQQMVHSIHSILYHIINVDSLFETNNPYQAINIVLDEIELYYHPEYQRLFVEKLLENLARLKLRCISGLNLIFSTHSPFILSDIPHRNVLKLIKGVPESFNEDSKTFGANIHEMLTDSFFLEENLIGALAEKKINACLKKLYLFELERDKEIEQNINTTINDKVGKTEKRKKIEGIDIQIKKLLDKNEIFLYKEELDFEIKTKKLYQIINLIGEPVIKYKLFEMYDEIFASEESILAKARRDIQEIMERNGIRKEDI